MRSSRARDPERASRGACRGTPRQCSTRPGEKRLGAAVFPPRPRGPHFLLLTAANGLLQDRYGVLEDSIGRLPTDEVDTGGQLLTCLAAAVDHQLVATRRHVGR